METLTVKLVDGKKIYVDCDPDTTVKDLKTLIQDSAVLRDGSRPSVDLPADKQCLILKGQVMNDSLTLEQHKVNFDKDSVVCLIKMQRPATKLPMQTNAGGSGTSSGPGATLPGGRIPGNSASIAHMAGRSITNALGDGGGVSTGDGGSMMAPHVFLEQALRALRGMGEAGPEGHMLRHVAPIWDGPVRTGTAVKVVQTTYGAAGVSVGDIGLVRGRDDRDGVLILGFPGHPFWRAADADVVAAETADQVRVGTRVRVRRGVTEPMFQWGTATPEHVGFVGSRDNCGVVCVEFGSSEVWHCTVGEMEVVHDGSGHWPGELQCGMMVRVTAQCPPERREGVPEGAVGVLTSLGGLSEEGDKVTIVQIKFKNTSRGPHGGNGGVASVRSWHPHASSIDPKEREQWVAAVRKQLARDQRWEESDTSVTVEHVRGPLTKGQYSVNFPDVGAVAFEPGDIEVDAYSNRIRPGVLVKVKPTVLVPKSGWGGVSHGSVGTVTSVSLDGTACIRFPQKKEWYGILSELQIVEVAGTTAPTPPPMGASSTEAVPPAPTLVRQLSNEGRNLLGALSAGGSQPQSAEPANQPQAPPSVRPAPVPAHLGESSGLPPELAAWFSELKLKPQVVDQIAQILEELGAESPQELADAAQEEDGEELVEQVRKLLPAAKRGAFSRKLKQLQGEQ